VWSHENASLFQSSIEDYFERTCHAADCILKAICDGIVADDATMSKSVRVLSESTDASNRTGFERMPKNHTSILTLLGYQPGSRHKKGSKGYLRPLVSAHTDVGVITVLLFDDGHCAALQRAAHASNMDPDNTDWLDVRVPCRLDNAADPVFVVNVGDCLSELSGGSLRSTLHRVVPRPRSQTSTDDDFVRTCLALFVGLTPSAALVLPAAGGEVVSYETWRRRRVARAIAVLKQK
jgi:isopenicillin N synthase-like dioxygenase